jgi:virulence-associated protein VapD
MSRPLKNKKGGLSHTEKGRIIYLFQTLGDTPETYQTIADDLKRPINSIKKCIQEIKLAFLNEKEEENKTIKKSVIQRAMINLINSGLSKESANAKIDRVLAKLNDKQKEEITDAQLVYACQKLTSDIDYYAKSNKDKLGVIASTEASSERADSRKQNKVMPKNPAIFKINPDE